MTTLSDNRSGYASQQAAEFAQPEQAASVRFRPLPRDRDETVLGLLARRPRRGSL